MKAVETVETIAAQLDEDRAFAREAGQSAAAVTATVAKAKLLGLMIDRKESGQPGDFTAMDEQAVREVAAQQLEELGLHDAAAALRSGQDIGTHQPTAPGGDAVN